MLHKAKNTQERIENIPADEYYSYVSPRSVRVEFNGLSVIASLIMYVVVPAIFTAISMVILRLTTSELFLENHFALITGILYVVSQFLVLGLFLKWFDTTGIPMFNRRKYTQKDFLFLGWFAPITIALPTLLFSINNLINKSEVTTTVNQDAVNSLVTDQPLIIGFLMVVILAPIVEDIIFRGILLFSTKGSKVTWLRMAISSLIFGLLHVPTDLVSMLIYTLMGLCLAYAVKRTNKVESSIFIHGLNNLLGFIMMVI